MDILFSTIAGVIQGLTEFLPISSSGHLVIFHDFFKFDFIDNLAFDVVLHLGTLVALIVFFFNDILKYLVAFFESLVAWNLKTDQNQRLAWYLFIATLPAAITGYFLEAQIEMVFRSPLLVALMLIVFGVILYLADKFFLKLKTINELSLANSLTIGFFQAIALIPGVSRSGITIIAGLSQKLKRKDAARFAFLLAVPIVFSAGLKKTIDLISGSAISSADFLVLTAGFLSSAVVGYFCIKYFLKFLENHSLKIFAWYRIVLGLIIILVIFLSQYEGFN